LPGRQAARPPRCARCAQKREADRATNDAQAAADRLEREHLRQEKAQAGRQATLIVSRPAAPKREAEKAGRRSAEKS